MSPLTVHLLMSGEDDLARLLGSLGPVLDPGPFTFATVERLDEVKWAEVRGFFREAEGFSLVLPLGTARAWGVRHDGEFAKISFTVHSSLAAVGLTARVSAALAARGIACNIVAGFYHDHLFVPTGRAEEAMALLARL